MNLPIIRQDYHKDTFYNGSTINFYLSKLKASLSLSIPTLVLCSRVFGFCSRHPILFTIPVLFRIKKNNTKNKI